MYKHAFSIIFVVSLLAIADGCDRNSLNLQEVSGAVTLDSQPLDNGSIRFTPTEQKGVLGSGMIIAGEYRIPQEKGLSPGSYIVQISSADQSSAPQKKTEGIGIAPPPFKERIPEKYNVRSELTIEVKPDGGNVFDFDLSSRAR